MKGVIYARYSSDNQREESIEGQIRECKEFAERSGITVLTSYIDRALSAKSDNRPEFQRMIKDSAKHLFDVVIVWKLDRFARNRSDSANYKALLRKNGVKVLSATETISEGSEGIILEAVLEGYAEYFSAELSEKVIRGMTENALKGKYNGGSVTFGYTIDSEQHFQIDPVAASIVRDVFKHYAEGATMKDIANHLNRQNVRTSGNKPMSINSVTRILKNRRYIGEYRYWDVVQVNGVPSIVPNELFERVQELIEKNKRAPARRKAEERYLLTTKLFCGQCGAFMVGESGTSHTMKVYHYYKCTSAKTRKGCKKKAISKDFVEDLVVSETIQMLFDDAAIQYIVDMVMALQRKESVVLPHLRQQLEEAERGIQNLLNAIQQGILTPSTKQRLEELEQSKANLEASIVQEQLEQPMLTREQIIFWLRKFRDMDITQPEQKQRLIDGFVNAIYVYDDKLVLTFNYKDGSKTITLSDVNGSDMALRATPT